MGIGVVVGFAGQATCTCRPTSSGMCRDTPEHVAVSTIWLACRHSTRCPKAFGAFGAFEPSASQATPCLAGFRVWGNKPRGILKHGLPTAMLLGLLVAGNNIVHLIVAGHTKSTALMLPLCFLFVYHHGPTSPRCKSVFFEFLSSLAWALPWSVCVGGRSYRWWRVP